MGARRSSPNTGLRIAIALAAGIVVGGAAPPPAPAGPFSRRPATRGATVDRGSWAGSRSRSPAGRARRGSSRGTRETGKVVVLTAGHCLAGSGLSALWSHHGVAIGRASVEAFRPGSSADVGAIDLTDARASNEVYGSSGTDIRSVTAWASNASQTVGSASAARARPLGGVADRSSRPTSMRPSVESLIHHTWWTDFPSAAGDSGSPVLDRDGRAAGIVIATTPTQSLYSTVEWIATELHARPCVTPSCD